MDNFELLHDSALHIYRRDDSTDYATIMDCNISFPEIIGFSASFASNINTNSPASVDSKIGAFRDPVDSQNQPAKYNASSEMGCQYLNPNITRKSR
ncbi:hypothetical protein OIU74_000829 [Salix koriyanagi]|uniref:Uncharacterized protein n=1 Tax=Salix koriyanagi TaxID=2511006 RepID=A0A9Q0X0V7_9ROSI|nr:hypothetical protein OIU74_000829 [Salix koriyanagi]